MALNFGLLGDAGAPAMGYIQGQQDVARNQLAQQQVETGRMTQDKMRMEMDSMRRRQAGLDQFMQKAKELGVDGDPEQLTQVFYEHAISTGDMQQVQAAQIARQAAKERKEYMASQPGAGGAVPTPVPAPNISSAALPAQVNAMTPPAAAPPQGNALAGNRLAQIENRLRELRRFPTAGKQERDELIKERDRLMTPHVVGDSLVTLGGGAAFTAPAKTGGESPLAKLQREMAALPPGDSRRAQYVAAINKETTRAPGTVVNIDQKQEGAFATGLGKGQSDRILANQVVAQDAAAILETNQVGRNLLKAGAITGTGAEFFVGFNNALKQAGVDFGYADAASNSQAYAAAMGANVGRIIKQFGAGTGLSDADREYAAQIAGGKIALTEASLRKILDINDRAANRVIDLHNKNVGGIKTNIPLTVEKPTFAAPPPSGASLIPGSTPAAAGGGATVTLPDGRIKTFPNAAAANQFKKAAGL